jgi:hypothetical protein
LRETAAAVRVRVRAPPMTVERYERVSADIGTSRKGSRRPVRGPFVSRWNPCVIRLWLKDRPIIMKHQGSQHTYLAGPDWVISEGYQKSIGFAHSCCAATRARTRMVRRPNLVRRAAVEVRHHAARSMREGSDGMVCRRCAEQTATKGRGEGKERGRPAHRPARATPTRTTRRKGRGAET